MLEHPRDRASRLASHISSARLNDLANRFWYSTVRTWTKGPVRHTKEATAQNRDAQTLARMEPFVPGHAGNMPSDRQYLVPGIVLSIEETIMVSQNISQTADRNALIITIVLSCVFVIARGVARYRKTRSFPLAIEDLFLLLALASFIGMAGVYLYCLPILFRSEAIGAGKERPYHGFKDDMTNMLHGFLAAQLIFWLSLWSVKLSLLFLFRKLTIGLPDYIYIWTGIMVFTVLSFVGCVISGFTSCSSLHAWFTAGACETARDATAKKASLYYSLAVDLLTDLLIMVIPIKLLWTLRISTFEKLSVGFAFSVGIITMIIAIIRVVSLDNSVQNGEVNTSWLILWAAIEVCVAILVGCLPAFAIFVRTQMTSTRRPTFSYDPSSTSYIRDGRHLNSSKRSRGRSESFLLNDIDPNQVRENIHDPSMTNNGGVSWTEVTARGRRP
ncbi:hypothetical protein B7463_g6733, partial [Scytalidium lignicola]